jgi:general secretion pathway protein I
LTKRTPTTASTRTGGFTLLEVLVALAIIAIALGAILSTTGSQASSATYLKQKTIAHWVAMNEITQMQIEKDFPAKGEEQGKSTMAGVDWYWTRTVKETEDDNTHQVEYKVFSDKKREQGLGKIIGYVSK